MTDTPEWARPGVIWWNLSAVFPPWPTWGLIPSHPVQCQLLGSDNSLRPAADSLHHCRPCQPQLLRPLAGPVVQHVWLNAASSVLRLRADYCLTPLSRQRPAGTAPVRSRSARGRRRLAPDIIKSFATTGIQINLHDNREGLQTGGSLPGCMKFCREQEVVFVFTTVPHQTAGAGARPPADICFWSTSCVICYPLFSRPSFPSHALKSPSTFEWCWTQSRLAWRPSGKVKVRPAVFSPSLLLFTAVLVPADIDSKNLCGEKLVRCS